MKNKLLTKLLLLPILLLIGEVQHMHSLPLVEHVSDANRSGSRCKYYRKRYIQRCAVRF